MEELMKKFLLVILALGSMGAFAQSIVLENQLDIHGYITESFVYNKETGKAAVNLNYGSNDPEGIDDAANFTVKGLSFDTEKMALVFNNGVNEYVCGTVKVSRVLKIENLKLTGICKINTSYYNKVSLVSDGVNDYRVKRTYRKTTLDIANEDNVTTTNWEVRKYDL